jgi:hypothetical protein
MEISVVPEPDCACLPQPVKTDNMTNSNTAGKTMLHFIESSKVKNFSMFYKERHSK